jgi:hypothetical protein
MGMVESEVEWWGEDVVVEEEWQPNINDDAFDGTFKLRSPSKIVFDMKAGLYDKKIKISIIL